MAIFHTIMHPTDFDASSLEAFRIARALAQQFGAKIIAFHVVEPLAIVTEDGRVVVDPKDSSPVDLWEGYRAAQADTPGVAVQHSEQGRIAYHKNSIASQQFKAAALEVELNATLTRGDNDVAQRRYEDMALAFALVGRECDQLATMLPAGSERDDYVRIGQDRRNRAEACRTSAALLRSARR